MALTQEEHKALQDYAQAMKSLMWAVKRARPVMLDALSVLEKHRIEVQEDRDHGSK